MVEALKCYLFVLGLFSVSTESNAGPLDGRTLRVTTIESHPFVIRNNATVAASRGAEFEGILIDVLKELASVGNFTYYIEHVRDGRWGSRGEDGVWNGMVGEVINNVADIAIAPLMITSKRAYHIMFTQPIMDAGLSFLYRKSPAQSDVPSFSLLLSPFTTGLWFSILLCFLLAGVVFYGIGRLNPYEQCVEDKEQDTVTLTAAIGTSLLYTVSSFFHQGNVVSKSVSGRILLVFWWAFSSLVLITFTANFIALVLSLSPDIRSIPFSTFDEMSRQTEIKYGVIRGGSTLAYFRNSERPMQQRMYRQMMANPDALVSSYVEGIQKVREGGYAFIGEGPALKYLTAQPPCDTMVMGGPLNDKVYGFMCSQSSDVCALLNPLILRLTQNHFITQTEEKYLKSQECSPLEEQKIKIRGSPVVDGFKSLGIRLETQMSFPRFSAAFFVLIGGCLLGILVLGGEILYVKKFGPP